MSVKRKSTSISINDKLEYIINIDKGESRKSVAKRLDVSVSTIAGWFKNKDAIYKVSLEFNNKRKQAKFSIAYDIIIIYDMLFIPVNYINTIVSLKSLLLSQDTIKDS